MQKIIGLFVICGFSLQGFAQEPTELIELEPLTVTAWRTQEQFSDVSRAVTIISENDIRRSSAKYLPQLIQEKSGIATADYLGNPKGAVVDVRGFGEASLSNVLVLINGRRTNQVDLSGVDWAQIDLNSIERIEIVRGPATVLYGDNSQAGVINIITKKGTTEKPTVTFSHSRGSYQYHKEYLNAGQDLRFLDYFFSVSHQDTSGYRANNDYWANDFFASGTLFPKDPFELAFSGGYHKDRYGMPGALYTNGNPFALIPRGINQVGRQGTAFTQDGASTSEYFISLEPKHKLLLGDNEIETSLFSSFRRRRSRGLNIPEADIFGTPYSEYETSHYITSYEFRPKVATTIRWRNLDNNLILGVDYFHAKDGVLSGNRIDNQQDQTDINKETIATYLHDNIKISDRLLFNLALRSEWAKYIFNQKRVIVNKETKKLDAAAFNFGVGYKYNDKSQIYIDISRAYRFPNTEEYYQNKYLSLWDGLEHGGLNTDIAHQRSFNYEVGIKDISLKWLSFNTDFYLMDIKNEIYYDPALFMNTNYKPVTRHWGVECEGKLNFFSGRFEPYVNWTFQEAVFKGGAYEDNKVPFVPKNKVSAGFTLSPLKDLRLILGGNYIGSRFKISDQRNQAPKLKAFYTLDTKLEYTYKLVTFWCSVKNITDKKYHAYGVTNAAGTAETYYPAAERNLEIGITLTF